MPFFCNTLYYFRRNSCTSRSLGTCCPLLLPLFVDTVDYHDCPLKRLIPFPAASQITRSLPIGFCACSSAACVQDLLTVIVNCSYLAVHYLLHCFLSYCSIYTHDCIPRFCCCVLPATEACVSETRGPSCASLNFVLLCMPSQRKQCCDNIIVVGLPFCLYEPLYEEVRLHT